MIDKKKIKIQLEEERNTLLGQISDMGKLNPETNEWEAVPEERASREIDQNDMADRFEDFESRSTMIKVLESRLNDISRALEHLNKVSFGKCEICKKDIESARLEVNPAATTCKEHLNS